MKANELMIGDWVHSPEFRCSIGTDPEMDRRIQICDFLERPDGTSGVDRYTPIPLTEEILKANGFTDCKVIGNGDICIRNQNGWNYVHELQHALRLCGLNELADNFKI